MSQDSTNAMAERASNRRMQALPVITALYCAQQAAYFLGTGAGTGDAPIHNVLSVSWLALSVTMLLFLTTGGVWFHPRDVRRLANDELTRAHRDAALCVGFIASMVACVIVYLVCIDRPVQGRDAVHVIMSFGIAVALVRFAFLERRAARRG